MTTELTFNPDLADELKALRRDKSYDGAPVVLDASVASDRGTPERTSPQFVSEGVPRSLDAIARFPAPLILATTGPLDAVDLALCCACTVAYVHPETELGEIDPVAALQLGLAGRLTERFGPDAAARLLLQPRVLCSPVGDKGRGVAVAVPDPLAAARATAARLSDPTAALLPRSLAFAARSTPARSTAYDSELLALLTDQERPR